MRRGSIGPGGEAPRSAVVVGAGIVGLSTAWFLQERGVEVTVVDRTDVATNASSSSAGWIAPGLAVPLNEPAVLRYALRSMFSPSAPLHVPLTPDPRQLAFLARFAAQCRWPAWTRAVRANLPLNEEAGEAYDVLIGNGVRAPTVDAPITAAFESKQHALSMVRGLHRLADAGQPVEHSTVTGDELRELVPLASPALTAGVRVDGQRYVDPGGFVRALGDAVRDRGADVRGFEVLDVRSGRHGVTAHGRDDVVAADVAVLATGAWLSRLASRFGVRTPVRAGRGYSFTVPVDGEVPGPIYLPDAHVACTPHGGGLRIAGRMEFRDPDSPANPARLDAVVDSVRPLLNGVRWAERSDARVAPRPVTPDGRPLVGEAGERGVFVAGGHGRWGVAHGPVTGRLLAQRITTGKRPEALRELDPLR